MAEVLIAGASGFLGSHLRGALADRGHTVRSLVRRTPSGSGEVRWDPYAGPLAPAALDGVDVVVNLAGAPTAGNPHSKKWAQELRESRVTTTRVLADAIAGRERPPAFLAGNGISYYGDHSADGDPVLTESSESRGDSLLTTVSRDWEAATSAAQAAGARVCVLRTSPVMDRRAAPLKQFRLLFSLGLGARLGSGHQHMAQISLRDWLGAVTFLLEHDSAAGPFNLCCPQTPTNAEFTRVLAELLHRRAFVAVPSFALKAGAGDLAPELLGSLNVQPAALEALGHVFADRDVRDVLSTGLNTGLNTGPSAG